jgi:murein DD-endopeptidase MepM/ murein hydrolase activator NlpD
MRTRLILPVLAATLTASVIATSFAGAGDSDPRHYRVDAGNTWQSIAAAHGVTADQLQVANNVAASTSNTAQPRVGWEIHIPVGLPAATTAAPTTTSAPTTTQAPTTTLAPTTTTTAPTTTAAPTTTTPSGILNCAPNPSACGYPDATNTGVQAGVTLTPSGCITASTPGQVIQNVVLNNCDINVTAPNVVIRNVKITTSADWAIIIRHGGGGTRIENVELAGRDSSAGAVQYAINSQANGHVTIDRANLHLCSDCIQGDAVTVTNSYIHDMASPAGAHMDGFQCNSSCGVMLRHNTILNQYGQTAAVAMFADFGIPRNSTIEDNLLAGGGYTIYGGTTTSTGIRIVNNRFSRIYFPRSGQYGPLAHFNASGTGNVWSGNVWDDTGAPLN